MGDGPYPSPFQWWKAIGKEFVCHNALAGFDPDEIVDDRRLAAMVGNDPVPAVVLSALRGAMRPPAVDNADDLEDAE